MVHWILVKWIIVETHRFEGFSILSDNAVLYVLEHQNGLDQGIIIDVYGANRDERISRFIQRIPRLFRLTNPFFLTMTSVPHPKNSVNCKPPPSVATTSVLPACMYRR